MTLAHAPSATPTELGGEGLSMLSQALLALRSTSDLGASCAIAGACAVRALGASEFRVLRVEARSGAISCLEESGTEIPYLAEHDGPVQWALRHEVAVLDDGASGAAAPRETLLWLEAPLALATLPLISGGTLFGLLLVGFAQPRPFEPGERLFLQTLSDALALSFERSELRRMLEEEHARLAEAERRQRADEEDSAATMSMVAHELRTPLTAIKANTEALLDNLDNPEAPRQRFLGIVGEECDRLTRLVGDILELSRLEAGQRPLRLSRLDLEKLIRETVEGLQPAARPQGISFRVEVEPSLAPEADPDLLRQLLINLAGNAVKYSPPGGTIRIEARRLGEEWTASVEDQGPGIHSDDLPHVFERFFRARHAGDRAIEGTGLGLAIGRGIVELHGGRIGVQSMQPTGTRFHFTLPHRQLASSRARRIARQVQGRPDLGELFERTVEMVAASMNAEIVSLMLVDPERGDLYIAASRGLEGQNLEGRRTSVRSGVAGSVAAWGRPLCVNNIETDRRFRRLNHPQYKTKSLLCVPLRIEDEVLGVINVNNKVSGEAFDEDDLSVLSALVDRVGSAVERACAYPESDQVVSDAVRAVRSVTRLQQDLMFNGHRAVHLARATAREIGMRDAEVDVMGYVASIHDLGMTRLGPRIASTDPLDQAGLEELVHHPEVSLEIIRPLEYLGVVRDIILSHHERWDGNGYPRGLRGTEIPLGGRILAVVDAFASMTRGRPYRSTRTRAEALEEMRQEAGRQFDPEIVEALARVLEREEGRA